MNKNPLHNNHNFFGEETNPAHYNNNEKNQGNENGIKSKWLDKQEVLQMLHISARTLQNWRSKGIIHYTRIGGKIFYKSEEIYALLEQNFTGK